MSMDYHYINTDPRFDPYIEGTRITVQHVAEYYGHLKWTPEAIADAFVLTLAQVHAALAYYYDHRDAIDAQIREDQEETE